MKVFEINGDLIEDIPSFYTQINQLFMQDEDWKIGESLDALNDLLYSVEGATIIWHNAEKSSEKLGYEATKNYYLEKMKPDSMYNKEFVMEKLKLLNEGNGQTYYEIIKEIILERSIILVEK